MGNQLTELPEEVEIECVWSDQPLRGPPIPWDCVGCRKQQTFGTCVIKDSEGLHCLLHGPVSAASHLDFGVVNLHSGGIKCSTTEPGAKKIDQQRKDLV